MLLVCRSTSSKKQSAFSKATKLHQKTQDLKLKKRQVRYFPGLCMMLVSHGLWLVLRYFVQFDCDLFPGIGSNEKDEGGSVNKVQAQEDATVQKSAQKEL